MLQRINKYPCLACPYLQSEGVLQYSEEDYRIFINQLQNGVPKPCHCDPRKLTACRGQRNAQLMLWYQNRELPEPTDAALAQKFKEAGGEIPPYILPD